MNLTQCREVNGTNTACNKHKLSSYSISSTIMDVDSTISSGRSTPVMMNGQGVPASSAKSIAYNCCWDHCHACFSSSPDLADHIRSIHVDGQRGGVGVISFLP